MRGEYLLMAERWGWQKSWRGCLIDGWAFRIRILSGRIYTPELHVDIQMYRCTNTEVVQYGKPSIVGCDPLFSLSKLQTPCDASDCCTHGLPLRLAHCSRTIPPSLFATRWSHDRFGASSSSFTMSW